MKCFFFPNLCIRYCLLEIHRDASNPLRLDPRYAHAGFQGAIDNALTDDGILVVSGGQTYHKSTPWTRATTASCKRRASLIDSLISHEYEVVGDDEQVGLLKTSGMLLQWNKCLSE